MIKIPKDTTAYINKQAAQKLRTHFRKRIEPRFNTMKNKMIKEFLNHPVTVEILAGPTASNTSKTLGGYGNLFSFIGFDSNEDPIQPILDILESTRLIDGGISSNGTINYRVFMPNSKDIFSVTPMPWAGGRSWAKGIETGISGIGQYMHIEGQGRSEGGIQSKNRLSGSKIKKQSKMGKKLRGKMPDQFDNTTYISALINKYTKLFKTL